MNCEWFLGWQVWKPENQEKHIILKIVTPPWTDSVEFMPRGASVFMYLSYTKWFQAFTQFMSM